MFDLNAIVSAALNAAVQQAVAPLNEQIAKLEGTLTDHHQRLRVLEGALTDRVAALERDISHTVQVQQANIVAALAERVAALESETQGENRYLNRDDVASLIEEAMDSHCNAYDHDDYDAHCSDDDKHFDGDIEDAVRDALSNMTFDVTVS